MNRTDQPEVAIIMGSQSDWPTMKNAADTLEALGVSYDARIVSAHRTPDRLVEFSKTAKENGFKVVIAGAGVPGWVAMGWVAPRRPSVRRQRVI
jgi:5-(carboxyamino)imidazole ribonucleotide mutase